MAWVISSDDQGGIFSFSHSISLMVLTVQIIRSFAFIFLLMIIWRNNLFSAQHCACAFPRAVRSAPVCDGPVGSTAGSCEVLDGVLLSPESKQCRKLGSLQCLALPALALIDVPPLGSGKQPYPLSPVTVLPRGLQGPSSPLCLCCSSCHETPVKSFSKQWSGLVQGRCANTRSPRMVAKVCLLRGE